MFDSYGPNLSPADLLLDYGFVEATNTNHRIDLELSDIVQPRGSRNSGLVEAMTAVQGPPIIAFSQEGPDEAAVTWARACLATDAELVVAGWRVKATAKDTDLACRVMGTISQPSNSATEQKVVAAFESAIVKLLALYPTSLEDDLQSLQRPDMPYVRKQITRAIASEKKALVAAQAVVNGWQQRMREGCGPSDVYGFADECSVDDDEDAVRGMVYEPVD